MTAADYSASEEMSNPDRGCAKTPALRLHVEHLSKFQRSEKKKHWRPLLGKDNRENYAARSSLVHVFTQAGPIVAIHGRSQNGVLGPDGAARRSSDLIGAVPHQNFLGSHPQHL